jgi:hypothetical protein
MHSLKQRRFSVVKEFIICEKGVKSIQRSFGQFSEFTVPFENITTTVDRYKSGSIGWLLFAIGLFIMVPFLVVLAPDDPFHWIIWLIASLLILSHYLRVSVNYLLVRCGDTNLIFFRNKLNQAALEDFLKKLFTRRKEYLKKRYALFDPDCSSEENVYRYRWLRDNEIITNEEYAALRKSALDDNDIGF